MLLIRDLKARGWTTQLIERFLGNPDATNSTSARGSGRPACLYAVDRVVLAERSVEFYRAKQKSRDRSVQVKSALIKRQDVVLAFCESIPLAPPETPQTVLLEMAARELLFAPGAPSPIDDPRVNERAIDIALRAFNDADSRLDVFGWTTGVRRARARLARRKLELIASHYPVLSKTCHALAQSKVFDDEKAAA
jgi:hypothetical protein